VFGLSGDRRPFGTDVLAHPLVVFFALVAAALMVLRLAHGRPVPALIPERALVIGCRRRRSRLPGRQLVRRACCRQCRRADVIAYDGTSSMTINHIFLAFMAWWGGGPEIILVVAPSSRDYRVSPYFWCSSPWRSSSLPAFARGRGAPARS